MIRNVLITGGGGSLAEFVVQELRDKYQLTLFDQNHPRQHREHPWEIDLPFVLGDLTSFGDCMRAITLARAEAIVHLGAIPWNTELQPGKASPFRIVLPEDETMRVNEMGTYYLVDAARRLGVKRVAFASSFYVLGLGFRITDKPFQVDYLPIDEEHPLRPEDTYSLSKVLGEEMLKAFSRAYGIQTIALRLQPIDHKTARGLPGGQGERAPLHPEARPDWVGGPTGWTYQYVDVRDAALAFRLALEAEGLEEFEAFYIQTDTVLEEDTRAVVGRTCPDLKEMAANLHGKEGMISGQRAREKLGYEPQHSWRKKKG